MSLKSCVRKLRSRLLRRGATQNDRTEAGHDKTLRLSDRKEAARREQCYQVAVSELHLQKDACDLLSYPQEDALPRVPKSVITVSNTEGRILYLHDKREWLDPQLVKPEIPAFESTETRLDNTLKEIARAEWRFVSAVKNASPHVASLADPESNLNK